MNKVKLKSILVKTTKYIGIGLVVILSLIFLTPIVFSDKLKEEIKKQPTENWLEK